MRLLHKFSCRWTSDALPTPAYIGEYGELVAASYLRAQGLKILRRNWRWGDSGELDLVCRDGDTLVAVEVKSTASARAGSPMRMVNAEKRRLLRHGLRNWLYLLKPMDVESRFDVVEVYLQPQQVPEIVWHKRAFTFKDGESVLK